MYKMVYSLISITISCYVDARAHGLHSRRMKHKGDKNTASAGNRKVQGPSVAAHDADDELEMPTHSAWSWLPALSDTVMLAVILLVAIGVSYNTVYGDFVFDDERGVVKNMDLRPTTPLLDLFKHDFWGSVSTIDHN